MTRKFARQSNSKSPVQQSAALQPGVIERLQRQQSGLVPPAQGQFVDLTMYDPDRYMESLNMVADLKRRFAALPSGLRSACLNDPTQLLRLGAQALQGDEVSLALLKRHGLSVTPPASPEAPKASDKPKEGSGDGSIPLD